MGRIRDDLASDPDYRVIDDAQRGEVAEHLDDTRIVVYETKRRENLIAGLPYLVGIGTWLLLPAKTIEHARTIATRMLNDAEQGKYDFDGRPTPAPGRTP